MAFILNERGEDVRGGVPLSEEDKKRPRFMTKRQFLSDPKVNYPLAGVQGHIRTIVAGMRATNCVANLVMTPFGQWSPPQLRGRARLPGGRNTRVHHRR